MTRRRFGLAFVLLLPCAGAQAATVQEQFKASVAELQNNPDSKELREKIIKLGLEIEPKPAVPEEADKHMALGRAAANGAKDKAGFQGAAAEFKKAALAAPWLAQAYYNLGIVEDKAGDYAEAMKNLELYLSAAPGAQNAKKVKSLVFEIEYRMEKAAKEKEKTAMALIPAGEFVMGANRRIGFEECEKYKGDCREWWFNNESHEHRVMIDEFYMDKYEVTQKEYQKVMAENPSEFKAANHPVDSVKWHEAKEYCEKVGKRLPTEAEWEKAARGGTTTRYSWGDESDADYAWTEANSGGSTHPVGRKKPNNYGLYDMAGNVQEWVGDWYSGPYYKDGPRRNPQGPSSPWDIPGRVNRGGAYSSRPDSVRPSGRSMEAPEIEGKYNGFRCAR